MTSVSLHGKQLPVPLWSLRSVRFRIAVLIALAMTIQAMLRNNLNMALVCMVRIDSANSSTASVANYVSDYQVDWTMSQQGSIHSSYYFGSLLSVFVTSRLCDRFGAKHLITFGVVVNVLGSLLTPVVAVFFPRYEIVCIVRFLMGFAQGFLIPCGSLIVAKWFTLHEKSTAMAIFTTGNQVGLAMAMFFTAKLCQLPLLGGWPMAFVLSATVGAAFLFLWIPFAADRPRDSRFITAAELDHINGQTVKHRAMSVSISTPYKKMFLCPVVLAICLCSFCQSFVIVSLATYLPIYNQSALKLDIATNGIWASIPFLVQMLTKFLFAFVADHLKKRHVSINLVTKACNSLASFGCCVCILWISFLGGDDYLLVMTLLCVSMGLFSGYVPGYNTSIVSVAPIFTAHISAYAQLYAQTASSLAPFVIGLMTGDGSIEEWAKVFYMLAGVLVATGAFFQFFGSGTVQRWAEFSPPTEKKVPSGARLIAIDQEQAEMDLLAVPRAKRTPKVSIMEEGDDFPTAPGHDFLELEDSVVEEE